MPVATPARVHERPLALLLAHQLPHPPRGGGDLRTWHTVRALAEHGPVSVVGLGGRRTPHPPEVLDWVAARDGRPPTQPPPAAELTRLLRQPGAHPTDLLLTEDVAAEVSDFVRAAQPAVVVVESTLLHRYIEVLRRLVPRMVLNLQNLEAPLYSEITRGRADPLSRLLGRRWSELEAAALAAVDQVWVCSEHDAATAGSLYPGCAPLVVVPNVVDVGPQPVDGSEREPNTLIYPATFAYPPNAVAVERLVETIFPAVAAELPQARLIFMGSHPTPAVRAAAERDARIVVTGEVDDATPWLRRATVMPIPLVAGGGTRLKALEAFAAGLPVVSTAKGMEGLEAKAGEHYVAGETDEELAVALIELIRAPARARALAARAHALVRERYAFRVAAARVGRALDDLGVRPSGAVKRKSLT